MSSDTTFDDQDRFLTSQFTGNQTPLAAGASYSQNTSAQLFNAPAGNLFVLIVADRDLAPVETDETNNVRAVPMSVTAPDLIVSAAAAPATAVTADTILVSWTVTNAGAVSANVDFLDYIFISSDATLDDNDRLLTTQFTGSRTPLAAGASYAQTVDVPLFRVPSGDQFLLIQADGNSEQGETDETDNITALPIELSAADITVTAPSAPASAGLGEAIDVSWTVRIQGTGPATADWFDRVFLLTDSSFDVTVNQAGTISVDFDGDGSADATENAAAAVTFPFTSPALTDGLPNSFWQVDLGGRFAIDHIVLFNRSDCCSTRLSHFRVSVLDDAGQPVFLQDFFTPAQGGGAVAAGGTQTITPPNGRFGQTVRVQINGVNNEGTGFLSLAEVQVFGAPDDAQGNSHAIRWNTANRGAASVTGGWNERVFVQNQTTDIVLPEGVTGDFFVLVFADSNVIGALPPEPPGLVLEIGILRPDNPIHPVMARILEFRDEGNNIAATPLPIVLSPAADLRVTSLAVPDRAITSQSFNLGYTVTNTGDGDTPAKQPHRLFRAGPALVRA